MMPSPHPITYRLAAVAVHVFTALGATCAFYATIAVFEQRWEAVFAWLGLAFLIDGIDGTFARMVDVERRLPLVSGDRLDLVVDYTTYVFVPALALLQRGYFTGPWGHFLVAALLLSSLYHFADLGNKSDDHCFVGFPAIWNIVAFHIFAFDLSQPVTAVVVMVCVALTFVRWRWVHPMRVQAMWPITLSLTALWLIAALWTVMQGLPASGWATVIFAVTLMWGLGLSLAWRWVPEV
jgi:phosphatidylcholine synthase